MEVIIPVIGIIGMLLYTFPLKALAINPNNYEAMANLGNVYFNKGNFDAAIEQYSRAARVKPDNAEINYQLGVAYFQKGNYANAIKSHLETASLAPKMADAHYALGLAYYKTADYGPTLKHIKTAEQLGKIIDPNLITSIENRH